MEKLESNIRKLQGLYNELKTCREVAREKYVSQEAINSINSEEQKREEDIFCTEEIENLEKFFEEIPEEDLREILIVLYVGKKYFDDPNYKTNFDSVKKFFGSRDKSTMKREILSKNDLVKYLSVGINYFQMN